MVVHQSFKLLNNEGEPRVAIIKGPTIPPIWSFEIYELLLLAAGNWYAVIPNIVCGTHTARNVGRRSDYRL